MKTGNWTHSKIAKVDPPSKHKDQKDLICLEVTEGWGFCFNTNGEYKPKEGDGISYRSYTGRICEVIVAGVTLYEQTDEEVDALNKKWREDEDKKNLKYFEDNVKQWDFEVLEWPEVFRRRIAMFRKNGREWRIQWEGYELASCREAVNMIKTFKNKEDFDAWAEKDRSSYGKTDYKPIDDGHSGNTWGFAKRLAHWYFHDTENVYLEHGVGTPLAGCEAYGCKHPRP